MTITRNWLLAGLLAWWIGLAGIACSREARSQSSPAPRGSERTLAGVVLDAGGNPASGAEVILCEPDMRGMTIHKFIGNADKRQGEAQYLQKARVVTTGADGKFEFKKYTVYFNLVVRHGSGVTLENEETFPKDGKLRVHPWGRVEGVLKHGKEPLPDREVSIECAVQRQMPYAVSDLRPYPLIRYTYTAKTDAQGRYVFDRIHSGEALIIVAGGEGEGPLRLPIEIKPEGITVFNLGGAGRDVTGIVALGEGSDPKYSVADSCQIALRPFMPHIPSEVFKTANGYQKWLAAWEQTPEGKTVKAMKGYSRSTKPEKDGRFSISDVPQGKYTLTVEAHANSNPKLLMGLTASKKRRKIGGGLLDATIRDFDIPPLPGVDVNKPLDLGRLEIVASTGPKVGDPAPDFTCETLDGKQLALRDYRGKFLLLVFWVKNYGPYDRESRALKAVWAKYGKRPDFAMISLSMDGEKEMPGKFIKENAMDWPQGYLGNRGDNKTAPKYGVYGYPAIMLIAPDGRVLEKELGVDGIAAAVDRALKGMQPAK